MDLPRESCQHCGSRTASLQLLPGMFQPRPLALCAACGRKLGLQAGPTGNGGGSRELWASLIDIPVEQGPCPACGSAWVVIAHTGLAGCPDCYQHFATAMAQTWQRLAAGEPRRALDWLRRVELERELAQAVAGEDFERAGALRDRLAAWERGELC